jgi:hypothetical protein
MMTKGERRKAIALALTRIEVAEKAVDEAYTRLHEKERELDNMTWHIYGAYLSEIRPYKQCVEEREKEWYKAKHEYYELTKCKAWKNL